MVVLEDIDDLEDSLKDFISNYNTVANSLRRLQYRDIDRNLIRRSDEYVKNEQGRFERIKSAYNVFSDAFNQICEKYVNEIASIQEQSNNEMRILQNDIKEMNEELKMKNEKLKKMYLENEKDTIFLYKNQKKSKMDVELVMKYPGSYVYREFMNGKRTSNGDVYIDCESENDELIVKYMKNDESLIDDLKKMKLVMRTKFIKDLEFLGLPIKKDMMNDIVNNEDNEMMEAWRTKKVVMVNGENATDFNMLLKKYNLFDFLFSNEPLKNIRYYKEKKTFFLDLRLKYFTLIEDYLKNEKRIDEDILYEYESDTASSIIDEFRMIGIYLNEIDQKHIRKINYEPLFKNESHIIRNDDYDKKLQEWLDYRFGWKLIYRASEHDYTASSFHEYCENKGPTLTIIKSSEGWIFGGYTSVNWSSDSIYSFETYNG